MALDKALNTQKGHISKISIPKYITDNLAFELREYQKEALARFLYYNENDIYDTNGNIVPKSPHLLWQMATGSGKTLIMAALILEMYKQGYRNFWFFVNSTDIIVKTIDNFTNSSAKKYQFAEKIEIDGEIIQIKQVENFSITNKSNINIKFSTINTLHQISRPEFVSEDSVTLDDFAEIPIVLIGDEAHHLNAMTKKEQTDESTWENSVKLVLNKNSKNRLFEFTATADLTNQKIAEKYENKLIYNYDLKHFRNDKYSKDVFTFETVGENENIMLRAILISQYRKHIAANNKIFLKPVILFKSKRVDESRENFEKFNKFISNLSVDILKKEFVNSTITDNSKIWNKAVHYFHNNEIANLVKEIKLDFAVDERKILLHDGTNKRIADQPKLLSTLENEDNPVRAIFAVNMLGEGWDVLNLFDIVRLDDTSGTKKTETISEAQLIGRGARYFSFEFGGEDKYKRKFDDNETAPLQVIEQMHYHCKHNKEYISELCQVLIDSGIMPDDNLFEVTLKMKPDFIDGKHKKFQEKNIYINRKFEKSELNLGNVDFVENELKEQKIPLMPNFSNDGLLEVKLATGSYELRVFEQNNENKNIDESKISKIGKLSNFCQTNVIRYALNCNKNFYFDKLKKAYPKLTSMSEFIDILGEKEVKIIALANKLNNLTPEDSLFICKETLKSLDLSVKQEQERIIVSKHFDSKKAGKSFETNIPRKYTKEPKIKEYNYAYDWYVYENSVLTDEEVYFVEWFEKFIADLQANGWNEIYLARNEKAVKLFSWLPANLGEGFEPDFILFMEKEGKEYVFYIEPKGNWAYDKANGNFGKEQWKEDLLLEIEQVVLTQQQKMATNKNWMLIGFPFYNKEREQKTGVLKTAFGEKLL
jgi:type III restriction enzyme